MRSKRSTRGVCASAFSFCNSLSKTVLNSDSITVFNSQLKTFLFSHAFSLSTFHFSLAHCLARAPLKLRPHGAIQNTNEYIGIVIVIIITLYLMW